MAKKTKTDKKVEPKAEKVVKSKTGATPEELIEKDPDSVLEKAFEIMPGEVQEEVAEKSVVEKVVDSLEDAEPGTVVVMKLTKEQVAEAEALVARRNKLIEANKGLKKRKSTASTRIKRGLTRKETLQGELDAVLGNQTPEQMKAEIFELEAEQESLATETKAVETEADVIRTDIDGIEGKLRVAQGLSEKPKAKKKSSKPRVVNTQAIQRSALVRALETRGWLFVEATGDETIDRMTNDDLNATVALMEDSVILSIVDIEEPMKIEYGKGAVLNVGDAIESAA